MNHLVCIWHYEDGNNICNVKIKQLFFQKNNHHEQSRIKKILHISNAVKSLKTCLNNRNSDYSGIGLDAQKYLLTKI